ncbi:BnaC01g24290D [Brassica napus]|uniref:BnaC01g24290D protein n=1 Tax=Brassica napus TaxID=3708 RepID=A0A078GF09_BRANA|nr:BnaC01g24290D [Brassica napus]
MKRACVAKINSMCRVFLWKGDPEAHNTARVAWSTVVKTKEEGGLGVKDLLLWNKACCLRLIWLIFFRPESVWAAWFKEVILKGSVSNYWTTKPSQSFSWLTNKLLKLRDVAYPLIHLRIHNGKGCRFWVDNWSPYGKLEDYLEGGRSSLGIPQNATLASLHHNGSWRLPAARTERQVQVLSFITTIIWESSLNQMKTLPPPNKTRSLTLLGWQATIYWIWNERNQHLHANRFRSVDSLFSSIDHQVRNKIQSFRESHPTRCSEMMQLWIC